MNAVGIDVSKGKSTVTILRPFGEIVAPPFEIKHTRDDINNLIDLIRSTDGESRVVMEYTGRYHEVLVHHLSSSDIFVSTVNPKRVKDFDNDTLRKVKSDKADSVKLARYGIDKWDSLQQYSRMDELRTQLKSMNRQFAFYTDHKAAMKNNLISILELTYPGSNEYFTSPSRSDGHQKWIDFAYTYWHVDCVRNQSLSAFLDHYKKWCKRNKYSFSETKANYIYEQAQNIAPVLPKDDLTKSLVKQAAGELISLSTTVEALRTLMDQTASKLPEYPIVLSMKGVGPSLGPQIIAEIGDITRFSNKGALTAFAGVDPGVNSSGTHTQKSVHTTKRGSTHLRKSLFQVMDALIKNAPEGDPVYEFMIKKRLEGKPYYVYMTAGCNKFLRIYYGRVKEYLEQIAD